METSSQSNDARHQQKQVQATLKPIKIASCKTHASSIDTNLTIENPASPQGASIYRIAAEKRSCERLWEHLVNEEILKEVFPGLDLKHGAWDNEEHLWTITIPELQDPMISTVTMKSAAEMLSWSEESVRKRLGKSFSEEKWDAVHRELEHAVMSETLALAARPSFLEKSFCFKRGDLDGNFLEQIHSAQRGSLLFWEQLASFDGHPHHPTAKCKLPLSAEQVSAYGPEFDRVIYLHFAALRNDVTVCKGEQPFRDALKHCFPDTMENWSRAVKSAGFEPKDFTPVPVHPAHIKPMLKRFGSLVDTKQLLLFPISMVSLPTKATMSLRTMIPVDCSGAVENRSSVHIKLPLEVQASSLVRYVSPVEAHDSPVLTKMLADMLLKSPHASFLHGALEMMDESTSIWLNYEGACGYKYEDARYLSCLLRDAPQVGTGEPFIQMPLAAVFSEIEWNGISAPVLLHIMKHDARVSCPDEARAYFQDYTSRVLRGILGLWVRFGLVLEAHQQNSVLVFDRTTGRLQKILYRDICGGLCGDIEVLEMHGWGHIKTLLHPRQDYILGGNRDADDDAEDYAYMIGALEHILVHSHLVPVARLIANAFGLSYNALLAGDVRCAISALCDEGLQTDPSLYEHIERTRQYLLETPHSQYKCLFLMRCMDSKDEFYANGLPNPLYITS